MSKILVDRKLLEHLAAFALDAKSFAMNRGGSGWKLQAQKALIAMDAVRVAMDRPAVEPFGYFRAEPFGWTDCAPTDEGAKALYEYPPPAPPVVQHLPADDTEGGAL